MSFLEFTSGAVFGAALFGAGVYAPSIIKAQMTLSSNVMIEVFLGASATSAIVLEIANRFKLVANKHRSPSNLGFFQYDGNVVGGALIGMGMALTGACPGTAFVQAGTGMANGMLVALGGVLGAILFIKLQWVIKRAQLRSSAPVGEQDTMEISSTKPEKSLDLATALHIHPLTLLLAWIPMCLTVILLASATDHSLRQQYGLVPPKYGGLLIGLAQLATTLLTGHAIGASAGYEDLARWIDEKVTQKSAREVPQRQCFTASVVFTCGIICSAAVVSRIAPKVPASGVESLSSLDWTTAVETIAGGIAMVFGARLARGCTSGHGISGLAQFSLSSLVTTVAMFSGGIATAAIAGR